MEKKSYKDNKENNRMIHSESLDYKMKGETPTETNNNWYVLFFIQTNPEMAKTDIKTILNISDNEIEEALDRLEKSNIIRIVDDRYFSNVY